MKLTSPAFKHNGDIPVKYSCEGDDINPPLTIEDVSEKVKSMVIILKDPDAPGGDFVHWLIWNIPPDTRTISEGRIPRGAAEGTNDKHKVGWGGPCPPVGRHRYEFHLYGLDASRIDMGETTTKAALRNMIRSRIVEEAVLVGFYALKKPY